HRCHTDPASLDDLQDDQIEPCEAACYDCLLSYRNQTDHQLLDRLLVVPILAELRQARLAPRPTVTKALDEAIESPLEGAFVEFLRSGGFRLPDRGQVYFEAAGTRPDFVYDDACAVIYVDGPHHDHADRQQRDRAADDAMRDLGYRV